jgi:hypothetical protein
MYICICVSHPQNAAQISATLPRRPILRPVGVHFPIYLGPGVCGHGVCLHSLQANESADHVGVNKACENGCPLPLPPPQCVQNFVPRALESKPAQPNHTTPYHHNTPHKTKPPHRTTPHPSVDPAKTPCFCTFHFDPLKTLCFGHR